jgi:hypothetical protein
MAAPVLQLKRTNTAGRVPQLTELLPGELAVNVNDGKLFLKQISSGGGEAIIDVTNPSNFGGSLSGTIQFAGPTSLQSSPDLFWDNANSRLGLRTTVPGSTLDIGAGDINISSTTSIKIAGSYGSSNTFLRNTATGTDWGEPTRIINGQTSVSIDSNVITTTVSNTPVQQINSTGVTVSGDVTATNVTATNNVTAKEFYQSTPSGTVNYSSKMMAMMIATGL